jgi:hypothetical protein
MGEPMDIAVPTSEDKQYILAVLMKTHEYKMTTRSTFNTEQARTTTLLALLNTLQSKGSGSDGHLPPAYYATGQYEDERTFGITKQLRKIIYSEPQFHK